MEAFPPTGKIQNNFFKSQVFPYCGKDRDEVTIGPAYGVDVSIVKLTHELSMAMTSDPLSLIPTLGLQESAWLSVQLMSNDMATTGFSPMYAQFVLNLPTTLSAEDFSTYWKHIHEYCKRLDVAITGGHTGRFDGLQSTVSGGGTMITIAPSNHIITSKGAGAGDILIMTKECALISTSILALSFPETVRKACGAEVQQLGSALFYETSAVEAGLVAGEFGRQSRSVTAMHDITEGGVMGALFELSHASGCALEIDETLVPVGDAQREIGKLFNIDPKYCVGAGSMVIAVKEERAESLLAALKTNGIRATAIGKVVADGQGVVIRNGEERKTILHPFTDPYWDAFYNAFNNGWK